MTIRIFIVDDHVVVRQGLKVLLAADPDLKVVGEADDGLAAIPLIKDTRPDVVLMDLLMPNLSGVEVIRRVRRLNLGCKILVLTASLEDRLVTEALQAGAHGYILKVSRIDDLVTAIKRVKQGQSALDPAVAQTLVQQMQTTNPLDELTAREREVFEAMARNKNNKEIADLLHVEETTVRTHVANVLTKLGLRDRTQVIVYALKQGIIHVEDLP